MWKLKLTYFYVKFFYSLIFNKLWKPVGACVGVCAFLPREGRLLPFRVLELAK